ncbi:MAG: hypothetical protein U0992_24785 [Planctomycetaceae bacterium]
MLVPVRLKWTETLAPIPPLVRQLFWIYGGYVVLTIVSLATASLCFSHELAGGTGLSRAVCGFGAAFWGIRLLLQPWLAAKPYLTEWWLCAGYRLLPVLFAAFTVVYALAAMKPT